MGAAGRCCWGQGCRGWQERDHGTQRAPTAAARARLQPCVMERHCKGTDLVPYPPVPQPGAHPCRRCSSPAPAPLLGWDLPLQPGFVSLVGQRNQTTWTLALQDPGTPEPWHPKMPAPQDSRTSAPQELGTPAPQHPRNLPPQDLNTPGPFTPIPHQPHRRPVQSLLPLAHLAAMWALVSFCA